MTGPRAGRLTVWVRCPRCGQRVGGRTDTQAVVAKLRATMSADDARRAVRDKARQMALDLHYVSGRCAPEQLAGG